MNNKNPKPRLITLKKTGEVLVLRNKIGNHFLPEIAKGLDIEAIIKRPERKEEIPLAELNSLEFVGNTSDWFEKDNKLFSKRDYFVSPRAEGIQFDSGEYLEIWLDVFKARERVNAEDSAALRALAEMVSGIPIRN